jgi:toxin ParE1/3/4
LKKYRIRITSPAEHDILDLFDYISTKDSAESAEYVLRELEELVLSLDTNPERGHYPKELLDHGLKSFREVIFEPYRIIYEVLNNEVVVHLCVDGRRDMQSLLTRRLVR